VSDADDLASQYSAALDDSSADSKTKQASLMFSVAEEYVLDGDGEEGSNRAMEALTLFREMNDKQGEQDSLRLLHSAYRAQGKLDYAAEQASAELAKFKGKDQRGEASMLFTIGDVALAKSQPGEAIKSFQEATDLFKKAGDKKMAVNALLASAGASLKKYDLEEATSNAKAALGLAEDLGDKTAQGKSQLWCAICSMEDGSLSDALASASKALGLFKEAENEKMEIAALELMVDVYLTKGLPRKALHAAEQALALCRKIEYGRGEGGALHAVVYTMLEKGEAKKALKLGQKALDAFQKTGNKAGEAAARCALASVYAARHQPAEAIKEATREVQIWKDIGDKRKTASALLTVSALNVDCGQPDAAFAVAKQAGDLSKDLQDKKGQGAALYAHVAPHLQNGNHDDAITAGEQAQSAFKEAGDRRWEARALLQVSVACAMKEELDDAVAKATEAQTIFQEVGDIKGAADALLSASDYHLQNKATEDAMSAAEEARDMCKTVDYKRGEAAAAERVAKVYMLQGEPDKAAHYALESAQLCRKVLDKKGESSMLQMIAEASLEKAVQATDSLMALGEQANSTNMGKQQRLAMIRAGNEFCKKARSVAVLAKWMGDKLQQGNALLFLAQAHLMKGRVDPAVKAAVEAEALFAECEEQVDQASSGSVLTTVAPRSRTSFGGWVASDSSEGPRPRAPLTGVPVARRAQALVFAAEALAVQGSPNKLEKAEEYVNSGLELARQSQDSTTEDRALQLLESLYGPAEEEMAAVQEIAAVQVAAGPASVAVEAAKKGLDPEWVRQIVENTAKQAVAAEDDELHMDAPLMESGMDSLSSVAFRNQLNQQIGMNMPAALMFDYPSMRAIVDHVVETSQS